MGLSPRSVAEIYCPASRSVGSGYFCTPRLILTARHVVAGALPRTGPPESSSELPAEVFLQALAEGRELCRVRLLKAGSGASFMNALPVWWSADSDVALLALTAPASELDAPVAPVDWADVSESEPVDVTATGFPEADAEAGIRESRQLSGRLNPLSGIKAGHFAIHVSGSIGRVPSGAGSSWAGMSGAALFAEDLLIGVVLVDADATHSERLEVWALPARTFADEPNFVRWMRWDGGESAWTRSKEPPSSQMGRLRRIEEAIKQPIGIPAPRSYAAVRASTVLKGLPQLEPEDDWSDGITGQPRIDDFLTEYLGKGHRTVPFGGRTRDLASLDSWLSLQTKAFALLTGRAGIGKSALLVRWLTRPEITRKYHVVFFPISIRFDTARSFVIYKSLIERLSYLHGDPRPCPQDLWDLQE